MLVFEPGMAYEPLPCMAAATPTPLPGRLFRFFSSQPISRLTASRQSSSRAVTRRAPQSVVVPGWLALRRRSSSGSTPAFSASSSSALSMANVVCGLP